MSLRAHDPIIAIATAPGRGGIGVIRISGRELQPLIRKLLARDLTPRHAHYLPFNDSQGMAMDAGIALYFNAPHSYTGEDVLELQGHGGPAVLRRILQHCLDIGQAHGLRLAEPGEFTQRAFLNDRMDLAQAEAVADLIDASSEAAARSAMASLSGAFSAQVNGLNDRIIHLRMLVEATLDFPEEEIDFLEKYQAAPTLAAIRQDLDALTAQARQGMILREGLHVVLAGQPNVGKSSLLNALAGDDIAIVTPIAGTTRDKVIQQIHIDGVPMHIIDTAGLRDTDDTVESIGIARSWAEIEKANVIIHLQDARKPNDELDSAITARLPARTPVLKVYNKLDLLSGAALASAINQTDDANAADEATLPASGTSQVAGQPAPAPASKGQSTEHGQTTVLHISAKTGQGLDSLRRRLLDIAGWSPGAESPWLARERHLFALDAARQHLALAADHASQSDQVLDLFAEELRLAHDALCEITGQFTSDDLLGEIFSSFCIGK
ncbi:tRNA uridine-5-carboxymethylaminomethyl(34) synthesis GTPase MnmE [Allopusillimonas ginsengisoli]|uniref:tRNA uridine-5-carboxymethylaminomethyl(34) synthesis GTPase MnmE n=1 Tax=Allopusillimonas ginsengisoli TaxID=453575 RepID=UPI00101FA4B3|nr:tRNA uridine-5-carboxymethylaminomethyl(34) synthesis GTPase MnmE [Allopusillimonas ginsengisoli]TEA70325.1 tRNA uridine-5-carboxymethylaminomethyl(34) synthesis GTPase MnmE [Allopusillimonas ginsengisoli]